MDKYLSNHDFTPDEIEYTNELLFYYNEKLLYSTPVYQQILLKKVKDEPDDFSRKLFKLSLKAIKYKPQLQKAIFAHGKRLFTR